MTTWTIQEKYSDQTAILYDAAIAYDSPLYTYNGKQITPWTLQAES